MEGVFNAFWFDISRLGKMLTERTFYSYAFYGEGIRWFLCCRSLGNPATLHSQFITQVLAWDIFLE